MSNYEKKFQIKQEKEAANVQKKKEEEKIKEEPEDGTKYQDAGRAIMTLFTIVLVVASYYVVVEPDNKNPNLNNDSKYIILNEDIYDYGSSYVIVTMDILKVTDKNISIFIDDIYHNISNRQDLKHKNYLDVYGTIYISVYVYNYDNYNRSNFRIVGVLNGTVGDANHIIITNPKEKLFVNPKYGLSEDDRKKMWERMIGDYENDLGRHRWTFEYFAMVYKLDKEQIEEIIYEGYEKHWSEPTAICYDGSFSYSRDRENVCSRHGGVKRLR